MKTMRHRIRIIVFLLVSSLLLLLFLAVRSAWFTPDGSAPLPGAPAASPSVSLPAEETPSPEPSPSAEPLFDTKGL